MLADLLGVAVGEYWHMQSRRGNLATLPTTRFALRITSAVLFAAFVAIATWVAAEGPLAGDRWALIKLHEVFGTSIDDEMKLVGDATDTLALSVVAVVISGVLLLQARPRDAARFVTAAMFVFVMNPLLKQVVGRSRPDIRPPPEELSSLSFPSGHAAGTAALAGAILLVVRGGRPRKFAVIVGAAFVGIVGFSRLALTVHYPSDVLASWLWVGAWIALVSSLRPPHRRTSREPPATGST